MSVAIPTDRRWLFGPIPDLFLGCGALYLCLLVAFCVGGSGLRDQARFLLPILFLTLGAPHYGATLLRVYEQREERRRYALFSVGATLVIAGAFGAGLFFPVVATGLLTLYLTWSPWHYTGQNYGIAVLFLRRRGVSVAPGLKRWFYASFILSYATVFFIFHGSIGSIPDPEFYRGGEGVFRSLAVPGAVASVVFPVLLAGYLVATAVSLRLLLTRASVRDLAPALVLMLSQALWFTFPMVVRYWKLPVGLEPFRWDLRSYYFFWIAVAHSVQYLWISTYYTHESRGWSGYGRYLAKTLLAGTAIWSLPVLVFNPRLAGASFPNADQVGLLVAACVNLHHFVLDGAIWKLRHSRIAQILIRPASGAVEGEGAIPAASWARRGVWALASAGCAVSIAAYVQTEVLLKLAIARNDYDAAETVLDRLDWLGKVPERPRKWLAAARRQRELQLERRLGLRPGVAHYRDRATSLERAGDWDGALALYDGALLIDPENPVLVRLAATAALRAGQPERARTLLLEAAELEPWNEETRRELRRIDAVLDDAARDQPR